MLFLMNQMVSRKLREVGKFFTKEEPADVSYKYPEEYLTRYIHESDGKKRFYIFSNI